MHMTKKVTRLYDSFKPINYKLHLEPHAEQQTFSGHVMITGKKTGRPSQRLTFHQHGLKINNVSVVFHDKKGQKEVEIDRINNHDSQDEVRLHSPHMLYPGEYQITLHFKGKITRQMHGLYPCFFELNGNQLQLLATQFESHHAREVFPCIDEPEAKATFDMSLVTNKGETVLGNTPIIKQEEKDAKLHTTFATTPIMSTYLLAFITGKLDYLESKTSDGKTVVRTYATPENVAFTDFALECAVKTLEFFNEYFAIPYPLEKCDLVALPDFASGAMENWGLITFREQSLLVDPENTSVSGKQYVAIVVAHELAHQWFGNLVTMKWWTDLWLNEGFASWIEFLAVDHLFPDWDMWTQFMVEEQQPALKLDALEHTHPIVVPVYHPDEIRTIFDTISYSKGASVIQMLHEYLGKDAFRDGLRFYLDKHKYGNTDTDDLWEALEFISGKPVKHFMHAWTHHTGYPIVQVTVDDKQISLHQERFMLNRKHAKPDKQHWPIPLLAGPHAPDILEHKTAHIDARHAENFKLNRGESGFYRVAYNATHLHHLGNLVHRGKLSPIDRLGLLSDTFEGVKAGYIDTPDALTLLEKYEGEQNAAVWDVIAASLSSIKLIMNDDELRVSMNPYVHRLIDDQVKRLGWKPKKTDSHFDRLLRPLVLNMASASDEPAAVKHALKLFHEMHHSEDVEPDLRQSADRAQIRSGGIDPDVRGVVYGTAARNGDARTYNKLLRLHNETQFSEERMNLCASLTGFKQPELIEKSLSLIRSDDVRLQDVLYWVAYSFMNRHAKHQTWEWLKKNWKWLDANMGKEPSFYRYPIYVARVFAEESFIAEFKEFFEGLKNPALQRSIDQGVEMIQWQSDWRNRDLAQLKTYFKNHK
jgi:puromycin-sensitive aminopeptidase